MVGLSMELLEPPHYPGRRRFQVFTDYMDCLRAAGAVPILLPPDADLPEALRWLEVVDGLLLTGGDDIDLRPLGGPPPHDRSKLIPNGKQALDLALAREACDRELPLFAVCLGMQELGLAYEAPYIQHLELEPSHEKGRTHRIAAEPGTLLERIVGRDEFEIPCFHHQALGRPGRLRAAAWSGDGVLEAVEHEGVPFALGVQWHPERSPDSPASRALFSSFVRASAAYRNGGA